MRVWEYRVQAGFSDSVQLDHWMGLIVPSNFQQPLQFFKYINSRAASAPLSILYYL